MTYDVSAVRSWERLPAADDSDENASAHDFVAAFRFVQSLTTDLTRGRRGLPEVIVAAIGDQDTPDREEAREADLTDVLRGAVIAICYEGRPVELELALAGVASFERLGLSVSRMRAAMAESAVERACLRSAFAG